MDIKLPLNLQNLPNSGPIKDSLLNLKIGQQLDVTVATVNTKMTDIALQMGNKTLQVQSNQPLPVNQGQPLRLQVTQLSPQLEFKIIQNELNQSQIPTKNVKSDILKQQTLPLQKLQSAVLKLNPESPEKISPSLPERVTFNLKEQVVAKIISVTEEKAQVQLQFNKAGSNARQLINIPIERATASVLKPNQVIALEVTKAGWQPEFKILTTETKITALIKHHLPKHESPVELINHLAKHLPELQKNEHVPATLKRLAQEIMQNLPQREHLSNPGILKQVVDKSGLFLEAKLPLLPQETDQTRPADFKETVLKLIQLIKNETAKPVETHSRTKEPEQLASLLQKAEGSAAKVLLDQLASLPKEESPKQLWQIEIPYLDKGKTESVKLEIEKDGGNTIHPENATWSVNITITPPHLGTVHCKVSYANEKINTHFWSDQSAITYLIQQNIDYLRQQFEASGLKTGHMDAMPGTPGPSSSLTSSGINLLDENV